MPITVKTNQPVRLHCQATIGDIARTVTVTADSLLHELSNYDAATRAVARILDNLRITRERPLGFLCSRNAERR